MFRDMRMLQKEVDYQANYARRTRWMVYVLASSLAAVLPLTLMLAWRVGQIAAVLHLGDQ